MSLLLLFWETAAFSLICVCKEGKTRRVSEAYLRIGKNGGQSGPQMRPQGQRVHDEVFFSGGQLHEACEALEAAELVVLQVHCHLFCCGQALNHRLQRRNGVNKCEWSLIQVLRQQSCRLVSMNSSGDAVRSPLLGHRDQLQSPVLKECPREWRLVKVQQAVVRHGKNGA